MLRASQSRLRAVVLKANRLYGELIGRRIADGWLGAEVRVFQRGRDALAAVAETMPDLFVAGVSVEDMDGLEHLEPFINEKLPILVVTARIDTRTFDLLRTVRYDGLYDSGTEGLENLHAALAQTIERQPYVSASVVRRLIRPRIVTRDDALTDMEQVVFAAIGDGSDNQQTADRLGRSPRTIGSHRAAIMRKLRVHHKGELMRQALRHGYVHITAQGVAYPGFERRFQRLKAQPTRMSASSLQPAGAVRA